MSSYYSDDESVDVRVRRYARAPSPRRSPQPHYIQTIARPRSGYEAGPFLMNPERTVVTHRSRSRERRSSPPSQQMAPVIIHNQIVNDHSDDDHSSGSSRSRHGRHRRRSHSRVSRRSSSGHLNLELERARRELEQIRVSQQGERDARRMDQKYRNDSELRQAKHELDEIKRRERLDQEEKRIRKEIELKQLEEERRATQEKERRKKEAELAVAKYKADEAERHEREKVEKDRAEREYQRRLQEDLIKSGVDERDIAAIIEKKKIKSEEKKERQIERPTYTRMSLRHIDIETLVHYKIEYDYDQDPGWILIKRWVPEWEQEMLWEHSRTIRIVQKQAHKDHKVVLKVEDGSSKKHHHKSKDDDQYMWVHKKSERRRSKSPGLLMYLAGGKPA